MPKADGEEGIEVYLRIRPPPTWQQSRLLATDGGAAATASSLGAARGTSHSPLAFEYDVEEDFEKSVLHLHTAQRLVQEAQRTAAATATSLPPSSVPANNPRGGGGIGGSIRNAAVVDDVVNNTVVNFEYRFSRVFKPSATQVDVFTTVAKSCVASVLDGMNGTIFAYGQTGSGKTYSITGGTESYEDRGLIPRAMAMIYEEVARRREGDGGRRSSSSSTGLAVNDGGHAGNDDAGGGSGATTYTITMSYLQIYNDKGQDLLNHGRDARTLEELPAVTIHEMEDDVVLKGLEQHSAPTLADALNLLFLGDTNRLYCETPMNKTSSRSHCIFTIYLEARSALSSVVRRSKLNLVDLAGSERVSKTGVSGTILTEARHINLSLHFLEQVIVALSEKAKGVRDHVPYRNSFLTMALRDSLGRNCKTVMLATAHIVASQVAETISTCQFAQRVAMIRQAPQVNLETDPVLLVRKLRAEVAQLKDEVAYLRANGSGNGAALAADRTLTADEKSVCRGMVDAYIQKAAVDNDWSSRLTGFDGDMARMYYCYEILRERLVREGRDVDGTHHGTQQQQPQHLRLLEQRLADSEAQVTALRRALQLKEDEMQMLLTVFKKAGHAGASARGGDDGLPAACAQYNAEAQTPQCRGGSGKLEGVPRGPFVFGASRGGFGGQGASADGTHNDEQQQQAEASLRQSIYRDAQHLLAQLRRSSGAARTQAAVAATPPQEVRAVEAALARVTTLAQEGRFTEAEVAAATEFLESKRECQRRVEKSHERCEGGRRDEGGGGRSSGASDGDSRTAVDVLMDEQLVQDRAQAFEAFKASYAGQHAVEETKQLLRPKYAACKATAQQLNACVDTIKELKHRIQRRRAERAADGCDVADAEEGAWLEELRSTKERYNLHSAQLRQAKEEIDGMHAYLQHAQEQLVHEFERWFRARQEQVQLAMRQQQRHAQLQHEQAQRAVITDGLRAALGAWPNDAPSGEKQESGVCAAPPLSLHGDVSETASAISQSHGGSGAALSSLLSATQPQRSYAHSAHNSMSTVPLPLSMNGSGVLPSPLRPSTSKELVRGERRLASLPATVLTTQSARAAMTLNDGQPRSADAASARLSPPTAHRSGATEVAPAGSLARNGWTAALPPPGPSSCTPIVSPAAAAAAAKVSAPLLTDSRAAAAPSPTRPFHLLPIGGTAPSVALANSSASAPAAEKRPSNLYFPRFPSTGNAAADAQLAELYRAREAMRQQLQRDGGSASETSE
ncbi:hypothetical protein LSCM1_07740 [Leishmania martiniquensis]|uniref:Kinesin motor domain-containing protein n=1 Tax=Leishmania martiniquensis TaxID=1580590 RepID=A0A836KY10_9TRYP|nr:hypothetical protein LSCM1_07740 [Leishmania martiniquensis]